MSSALNILCKNFIENYKGESLKLISGITPQFKEFGELLSVQ